MPWFRLEDSFHSHPKVVMAGNEAVGLYVRCGSYSAQHLTNGFIPEDIAVLYGACDTGSRRNPGTGKPETLAETLVRTKLWRRARNGWRMPDYLDYNPSKQAVDNGRVLKAERQRRWRESHGRRVTNPSGDAHVEPAPPPPRPEGSGAGKPAPSARGPRAAANGRASPSGSPPAAIPKPPWCGKCEELTRQVGDPPARCPRCHPLSVLIDQNGAPAP